LQEMGALVEQSKIHGTVDEHRRIVNRSQLDERRRLLLRAGTEGGGARQRRRQNQRHSNQSAHSPLVAPVSTGRGTKRPALPWAGCPLRRHCSVITSNVNRQSNFKALQVETCGPKATDLGGRERRLDGEDRRLATAPFFV